MNARALEGKVALVTGGTTGIGKAIAGELSENGAAVLAGAMAPSAPSQTEGIETFVADLSRPEACKEIVEVCVARFGRIDILVNNAAITGPPALAPFLDATDEHLDAVIDLNLKAPFRLAREAARQMREGSVVVNIGSVAAFAAQQHAASYVASKAGLLGLTRSLAFELAPRGIRVVFVAAGDIALDDAPAGEVTDGDWWARRTPLGRRGAPRDVASAVAFLCSDQASFVTGTSLTIDGGWLSY